MLKLYVCKIVNDGSLVVTAETSSKQTEKEAEQTAIMDYHNQCRTLWGAPDVLTAMVKILDVNMGLYNGYAEYITHPAPEPESEPEPEDSWS